jgi:hypothetical protein
MEVASAKERTEKMAERNFSLVPDYGVKIPGVIFLP